MNKEQVLAILRAHKGNCEQALALWNGAESLPGHRYTPFQTIERKRYACDAQITLLDAIIDEVEQLDRQEATPEAVAFCLMCGNPFSDYRVTEAICLSCLPLWTKALHCLDNWRTLPPNAIAEQLAALYLYDAATGKSSTPDSEVRS